MLNTDIVLSTKMGKDFDFSTKLADMTVGNGLAIPTVRESSGAKTKPTNWEEFAANSVMDFSLFGKVITDRVVFKV
ncbi:hypothetical protein KHA80_10400 [Anaerobacillus sp. HL2]|nr:hypothetical protein KHA80_10400 [Anaerobacillus sp. HL2]